MHLKQKLATALAVIVLVWGFVVVLKASFSIAITVTAIVVVLRVIDYVIDVPLIDKLFNQVLDIEYAETLSEAKQKARKWLDV